MVCSRPPPVLNIDWQGCKEGAVLLPKLFYIPAVCALLFCALVVVVTAVVAAPFEGFIFYVLTKSRFHYFCGSRLCP